MVHQTTTDGPVLHCGVNGDRSQPRELRPLIEEISTHDTSVLLGNCKFPIRGNRAKPHTLVVGEALPCVATMLANPTATGGRVANARMLVEDAVLRHYRCNKGCLEGRVGEIASGRRRSHDPRMGRDGSVGPGPVVRGCALLATSSRALEAGSLTTRDHRGSSRRVPRSDRRSRCSTRSDADSEPGALLGAGREIRPDDTADPGQFRQGLTGLGVQRDDTN